MVNLSFVQPKNKLKVVKYNTELKNLIISKVKELDNLGTLKFDNELLKFVCSCVENGLNPKYEKRNKTDKKGFVIEIFDLIFSLNEDEKKKLSNNIDFIIANDLVQKVHTTRRCGVILLDYIKSKL
jgi:hypothetical protein